MAITINDIAKLAGVSTSTVSFVLNNHSKISEKTRKKVMNIIKDTGYTRNIFARGLVNSKTNRIAVVTPYIKNAIGDRYFGEGLSGIYETAKKHGYQIILEQASYEFASSKKYLEMFKEKSIDGMLYIGSTCNDTYLIDFAGREYPFLLVNSFLENMEISYVCADNRKIGYEAAKYFYKSGHRKIAFIYGSMNVPNSLDQYIGFKKFLDEKKIKLPGDYLRPGDFNEDGGYKAAEEILECRVKPTAIFCSNDLIAIGCIKALKERFVKIPEDISIIGCDNIKFCEYVTPKLTTFDMNIYKIASLACEKLIELIGNKNSKLIQIK
ncbi:LacI family DNA-binding transcriptional regulator, partial [Candidatus Dependentiae bacterium]|nr:LacI family DNA-binding transcriptional regulator [Candidatus Dependentiae bacterium]